MKIKLLIENIIQWQVENMGLTKSILENSIDASSIVLIEEIIEESFPTDLLEFYSYAFGQKHKKNKMAFLGLHFMNKSNIIEQLKFSKSLIKNEFQTSELTNVLIKKIIDFYINQAPKHSMFGFKKSWYKLEFECGIGHYSGPYLYKDETISNKDRTIFKIEDYSNLKKYIEELHERENNSWDTLKIIIYSNGKSSVIRETYKFVSPISNPKGAIKEKYFHNKWIPFISDLGGNFIGYDLDPGSTGIKGQIIIYGRDETKLTVIGNSLEEFLVKVSDDLNFNDGKYLLNHNHLFDNLRKLK